MELFQVGAGLGNFQKEGEGKGNRAPKLEAKFPKESTSPIITV